MKREFLISRIQTMQPGNVKCTLIKNQSTVKKCTKNYQENLLNNIKNL